MTIAAQVHLKRTAYFIHRETGKLLYENGCIGRFGNLPHLYRRISKKEWFEIKERRDHQERDLSEVQNKHKGAIIHVFGNGPSLNDFAAKQDWTGRLTFGVNSAGREIKPLTYWSSVDDLWQNIDRPLYQWVRQWLIDNQGKTIQFIRRGATVERTLYSGRIGNGKEPIWRPDYLFHYDPHGPHEEIKHGVYHTLSSTQSALDIARHMAPKQVVLWGVDYQDRSHSYTGSREINNDARDNPGIEWKRWDLIKEGFDKLAEAFKHSQIDVVNANPGSRLECYRKLPPAEAWALK